DTRRRDDNLFWQEEKANENDCAEDEDWWVTGTDETGDIWVNEQTAVEPQLALKSADLRHDSSTSAFKPKSNSHQPSSLLPVLKDVVALEPNPNKLSQRSTLSSHHTTSHPSTNPTKVTTLVESESLRVALSSDCVEPADWGWEQASYGDDIRSATNTKRGNLATSSVGLRHSPEAKAYCTPKSVANSTSSDRAGKSTAGLDLSWNADSFFSDFQANLPKERSKVTPKHTPIDGTIPATEAKQFSQGPVPAKQVTYSSATSKESINKPMQSRKSTPQKDNDDWGNW
ncbi:unnamed protein product, partial [Protopolystoma xenopodis]